MEINELELSRIVRIANEEGRRGKKVRIYYSPPRCASDDRGIIAVEDITPRSAADDDY